MHVIVTCKYEKDRIKNSREKVATLFSPIITLRELSVAMETRVSDPIWTKTLCSLFHILIEFDCDRSAGLRDINV